MKSENKENITNNKTSIKPKQAAAIVCILLLVLLYVATLVIAILGFPGSERLFAACLVATIGLPILLWIYIWLFGKYTRRSTMADLFPQSGENNDTKQPSGSETDDSV